MTNLQTLQKKLAALKAKKAQALMALEPKKQRGRPKGSKNKPSVPQKRGRPKMPRPGPKADSHRWVAVLGNEVIGYFKTPEAAAKAYNENTQGN